MLSQEVIGRLREGQHCYEDVSRIPPVFRTPREYMVSAMLTSAVFLWLVPVGLGLICWKPRPSSYHMTPQPSPWWHLESWLNLFQPFFAHRLFNLPFVAFVAGLFLTCKRQFLGFGAAYLSNNGLPDAQVSFKKWVLPFAVLLPFTFGIPIGFFVYFARQLNCAKVCTTSIACQNVSYAGRTLAFDISYPRKCQFIDATTDSGDPGYIFAHAVPRISSDDWNEEGTKRLLHDIPLYKFNKFNPASCYDLSNSSYSGKGGEKFCWQRWGRHPIARPFCRKDFESRCKRLGNWNVKHSKWAQDFVKQHWSLDGYFTELPRVTFRLDMSIAGGGPLDDYCQGWETARSSSCMSWPSWLLWGKGLMPNICYHLGHSELKAAKAVFLSTFLGKFTSLYQISRGQESPEALLSDWLIIALLFGATLSSSMKASQCYFWIVNRYKEKYKLIEEEIDKKKERLPPGLLNVCWHNIRRQECSSPSSVGCCSQTFVKSSLLAIVYSLIRISIPLICRKSKLIGGSAAHAIPLDGAYGWTQAFIWIWLSEFLAGFIFMLSISISISDFTKNVRASMAFDLLWVFPTAGLTEEDVDDDHILEHALESSSEKSKGQGEVPFISLSVYDRTSEHVVADFNKHEDLLLIEHWWHWRKMLRVNTAADSADLEAKFVCAALRLLYVTLMTVWSRWDNLYGPVDCGVVTATFDVCVSGHFAISVARALLLMSRIQSQQVALAKRIPEIKARVEGGADTSLKSAEEAEAGSLPSETTCSEGSAQQVSIKEREDIILQQVCHEIRNENACASLFGVNIDEEFQKKVLGAIATCVSGFAFLLMTSVKQDLEVDRSGQNGQALIDKLKEELETTTTQPH
eukprot:TRINITY_DN15794_c0_g2_i1.p1 TRINITY_DN15794_c0_g2~~TRINITY_DN15794_c0_g2_i1.p1  ORF type:complete len:857 (+),score=83.30 TRINITY_DN15794_c0_g2_i1:134-2704(+)